jgi:S-adenosylmethionine synthetase
MARYIAKNIVAAKLARRCEVQLAYSIGVADPVSVYANTFGTGTVDEAKLAEAIRKIFPLKPADLINHLQLKRPIFAKTSAYGHFGRNEDEFTWEKTDKVDELKAYFGVK